MSLIETLLRTFKRASSEPPVFQAARQALLELQARDSREIRSRLVVESDGLFTGFENAPFRGGEINSGTPFEVARAAIGRDRAFAAQPWVRESRRNQ